MSESNWAGQQGANNPGKSESDFKAGGMSDSQAQEAAAAARRREEEQRRSQS